MRNNLQQPLTIAAVAAVVIGAGIMAGTQEAPRFAGAALAQGRTDPRPPRQLAIQAQLKLKRKGREEQVKERPGLDKPKLLQEPNQAQPEPEPEPREEPVQAQPERKRKQREEPVQAQPERKRKQREEPAQAQPERKRQKREEPVQAQPERKRKQREEPVQAQPERKRQKREEPVQARPERKRKQREEPVQAQPERKRDRDSDDNNRRARDRDDDRDDQRASAEVRRLLADQRPASRLGDRDLRRRVQNIRDALKSGDVSRRQSRALRQQLQTDREELRARVANEEGRQPERRRTERDSNQDRELLQNRTPSDRLDRNELRRRVQAARGELERKNISRDRRDRLTRILQSDRRELRQWRRNRRADRREHLRRARRNNEIRITLGGNLAIGVDINVPVAEIGDDELRRQLTAGPRRRIHRRYRVSELRQYPELRDIMPGVEVDTIHFAFDDYQIGVEEIDELERIGEIIEEIVAAYPDEVFIVEGHTDAVGSEGYNQRLSEKRAISVREALLEYYVIEPENLVTVGYGEQFLRIPTDEAEEENRRVTLRRGTPFLEDRGG